MSSCVSLYCLYSMSSVFPKRWRTFCLWCGVLWCLLTSVCGLSCDWPCNPSTQCSHIDTSICAHGIVKDSCGCCDVCGRGPGESCGDIEGLCGAGMDCVVTEEGLSPVELEQQPGVCQVNLTAAAATTPTTQSTHSTPSMNGTENDTVSTNSTAEPNTIAPTQVPVCRQKCSVDYCNGRAKICSAQGMEFAKVPGRNSCQHTSCHACFLLVRPNCGHLLCSDPPIKKCLRKFYDCVREHYFSGSSSETLLLKLDDPRARTLSGRVVCHIADVPQ